MTNPIQSVKSELRSIIIDAYKRAVSQNELPETEIGDFVVEIPNEAGFGDFASNFAMQYAKTLKIAPRKIAETLVKYFNFTGSLIEKCEIAGPGFINFFVNNKWLSDIINIIYAENEDYGKTKRDKKEKIMVEFVSANPTGPMHMGNARGGALGDCLAEILTWSGNDVSREFYVNDAGNQIEKFYDSLNARYHQIFLGEDGYPFPEDGYFGDDIKELANDFYKIHGNKYFNSAEYERKNALITFALDKNIAQIKSDLIKYRIDFDVWFYESSLHKDGEVSETVQLLKDSGHTYEKDGALWFNATEMGAEKDEVLIRSNGFYTYFAVDMAYHRNKFNRGFDKVIDILGADHHGHVVRFKEGINAVGVDSSKLDIILMQLVNLIEDGKPVKMSKRTGKAISLSDLLEDISVDAARFFFNLRAYDSHFDFDLDLAKEQTNQNPVYYVQYAFARISSILRVLSEEGITVKDAKELDLSLLTAPEETLLIKALARFPEEIVEAAKNYDPSRITRYIIDISSLFHKFYNECRVKDEEKNLMDARLMLCWCVRTVIKNALALLKVTAPERM